ncbi:MAG: ketosteroid isomerase [Sphingobacteriaceae bacterium]|nr:MAG: ketosteroid isomerase [Sphingobacteriaceae bacterium]
MESNYGLMIKKIYAGFNARNIDTIFSVMSPSVYWPKAFDGGYITGYEAVRAYWTKQWSEINPKVEPVAITKRPDGKVEVLVDQLVKNLNGNILFQGQVKHIYTIKDNLISSMDIEAS